VLSKETLYLALHHPEMIDHFETDASYVGFWAQALVSFKKYMPPPLYYFKVSIYHFPLPHFASIFFAYL
jgi:hypothetical protein